jgi:hypothetical protein
MAGGAVLTEDLRPEPRSTYAISRLACEHVAATVNSDGADLVVFRLPNSGEHNYALVTIPPGIWNGFKGEGTGAAMVANCATIPHDPDEIDRMDPFTDEVPYDWDLKHG